MSELGKFDSDEPQAADVDIESTGHEATEGKEPNDYELQPETEYAGVQRLPFEGD